jgi:hypothetical protein
VHRRAQVTTDQWQEISHAVRQRHNREHWTAKLELMVPNDQRRVVDGAVEAGIPLETSVPLVVGLGGTHISLGMAHDVLTSIRIENVEDRGEIYALVLVVEMVEERLVVPTM